ncbi:HAD family hydrolase [Neptuniibacter sp. 1_MG-2023]|uniref:HAD family hydrolase n=1 Tax=Neptuniibacter sp. 1_MG-2023 TaxID=3062662 RepID=UPI0026E2B16A|nr:HAD-IA family hydrolase [Neptuniibacter sp. 1_MG-2023]MDO6594240.1 HAD-IA family hydrolase [Neptuniibacter sp. 1_MG-2023]
MIKCITFDLDDTLWAVDPVIKQANQTMFDWLAQYAPAFTRCYQLKDLAILRTAVLSEQPDIAHSVTQIRMAQLCFGLEKAGYSAQDVKLLTEQAFDVFLHARQQVSYFEHARETLLALKKQGYILGALSNGNADIHKVGLADVMDFQFKADDVGAMKPHPLMFEQMLAHTNLRPEQVIHIGDNPQHDIEGAEAAGLWTIWVNLKQDAHIPNASKEVNCLSEIVEKVEEIREEAVKKVVL